MDITQQLFDPDLSALPDRLRLTIRCSAPLLALEAAALPETAWIRHFVPDHYRGDWSVLPLRAPADAVHPIMQITSPPDCDNWVETSHLDACPAMRSALNLLHCEVNAVRLMRLGPGSEIREHRDHDLSAEFGSARLHLPLTTNPDVEFLVNGRAVAMLPGELWYLRLSDPHAVVNRGTSERIHMVIDVRVNKWLGGILWEAASPAHGGIA